MLSSDCPRARASASATARTKAGSLRLPRWGTGARYGPSVSTSSRSGGQAVRRSVIVQFLNVIMPLKEKYAAIANPASNTLGPELNECSTTVVATSRSIATMSTSASRARARTASRSGSNAASPRWQWASTSTSHGRFGADLGATSAARRGWRGERNGARGTERPGATRVLARPALLDVHEERRRDIDRREGPREDREGHHQRKRPQHLAREQHERDRRRHGGPVCENGARQRLVDREIQDLVQVLAPEFAQVLPDAIEDDDRVVERVADHGQDRADDHETHFEVEIPDERDRGEDVVERREHGGEAEAPLEPDGEVNEGDDERKQDREEGLALELAPHLRADRLGAQDLIVLGRRAQGACQGRVHRRRGGFGGAFDRGVRPPAARPDHVFVDRAALLNLRVANAGRIERAADALRSNGLGRLHLNQRAAGELDGVVQAAHQEQRESGNDDRRREPIGPAAPLDEVVIGVGEESDHLRRSRWPCPADGRARSCRRCEPRRWP